MDLADSGTADVGSRGNLTRTPPAERSLPRLPDFVVVPTRARDQLDRWAPVTVLQGPQGYGKTTLVVDWLREQSDGVAAVWVSARETPGSESFGTRLHRRLVELGLLDHVAAASADEPDPAALLDQVVLPIGVDRVVVVIDDAHSQREESLWRRLVQVVAHDHRLHLVICSRGRHVVENAVADVLEHVIVPARALLLTSTEILALGRAMGVPITSAQAETLWCAIGGWPAAVRMVLTEVGDGPELPLTKAIDYLTNTVLPNLGDQEVVDEVLRFLFAERLTHRVIRDLADTSDAQALIRAVEASGLAERHYEANDVALVLPPLVRRGLCEWYAARRPEQARDMHRRLARWFADHDGPGHGLYALHHAVAGEDWTLLDRVWCRHSVELGLERPEQLVVVLGDVPESVIAGRPGMRVARAAARVWDASGTEVERRLAIAREYGEACRRLASRGLSDLPLHDLYFVGSGALFALRAEGRVTEADDLGVRVERAAAARADADDDPGDQLPWFLLHRGLSKTLLGDHSAAIHHYQRAWHHRGRTAHVAATAAGNLALSHALAGDTERTRTWLRRHREQRRTDSWARSLLDSGARLASAHLALDRLDPGACRSELNELGNGSAPVELWPISAYLDAEFRLHYADAAVALGGLEDAVRAHPPALAAGGARHLLTRARADLLIAEGQGQRALALLTRHTAETVPILGVALSRLQLLAGNPLDARRVAARVLWSEDVDNRSRQELLVLMAVAAYRMGDAATAVETWGRALALYAHTKLLLPFLGVPAEDLQEVVDRSGLALPPEDAARVREHNCPYRRDIALVQLTPREEILARALATVSSRQEIAAELFVSVNTVRAQLSTLYRKLGVRTRDEALIRLAQLGLTGD